MDTNEREAIDAVISAHEAEREASAEGETPEPATESAPVPAPGVLTREQIAERVRERLDAGTITERDVLVDIFASQYHAELILMSFRETMDSFQHSAIGRMMTKRMDRETRKRGRNDGDEVG